MKTRTAVLLIHGPDRKGLVARFSGLLFRHGANILDADQHTDPDEGLFLQRIRFVTGALEAIRRELAPLAAELRMNVSLVAREGPARVAVLASKSDHCLMDLLLRVRSGELPCTVELVAGNHRSLVSPFGHRFHLLPESGRNRRLLALLRARRIDLVVLARYMQILDRPLVAAFPRRIINIHHGFLPAFRGARPYHRAHARGVKLIGATAHYVTEVLDEGPIIEQETVRVSHRDTVEDLMRKGRDLEKVVLARAVLAHLEDRVLVYGNRTVVF